VATPLQALGADLGGPAPECFALSPTRAALLPRLRARRHDGHPAAAEPCGPPHRGVRRPPEPDRNRPLHRRRHDADFLEIVEAPLEAHEALAPQAAQHLGLFGLARAARLPLCAERFILDVVPSETNAEPQAPA